MKMTRHWAMPNAETFTILPIADLVKRYLRSSQVSIDPFARNSGLATFTNDLNPDTIAFHHLPALEFLELLQIQGVKPDLVLFDPPYSHQQAIEMYAGIGREYLQNDAQSVGIWQREKDLIDQILVPGGHVIHCGWHSNGMGKGRRYEMVEVLLVAHGRAHNDTIITVERKLSHQLKLDLSTNGAAKAL